MFQNWGFLLTEIWLLLILAALVGLLAGWIIWGRGHVETVVDTGEAQRAKDALTACQAKGTDLAAKLNAAETRAQEAEARAIAAEARARAANDAAKAAETVGKAIASASAPAPMAALAAKAVPVAEPAQIVEQARPKALTQARAGQPDDLKLIKGIGPKLEILCHTLGFFHFDQIAAWTESEIAWVDDNLEGFKGRVTRDEWVAQAKELAASKS